MIIEQAFHSLPEILCGSHYPKQEYESGLVVALTQAILQELNGRNAPNPLSYFQVEKLYRSRGNFPKTQSPRYLRADLYLNIANLRVGNRSIRQYGWKHYNWLEAKFFRNQSAQGTKHSGNKTNGVALIIEDLLRLAILVREEPDQYNWSPSSARYFLHVYDSEPKWYLPFRKRGWLKQLVTVGKHEIELTKLDEEPASVKKLMGGIDQIKAYLTIRNQVIEPIYTQHYPVYHCVLTRIDKIKIELDSYSFEIKPEGKIVQSSNGAYKEIVGYLASNIRLQPADVESDDTDDQDGESLVDDDDSTDVSEE